jgi:hypothetical protein
MSRSSRSRLLYRLCSFGAIGRGVVACDVSESDLEWLAGKERQAFVEQGIFNIGNSDSHEMLSVGMFGKGP